MKPFFKPAAVVLLLILLLYGTSLSGQGLTCEDSEPFCTGTIYTFPAGTTGTAQSGAYYGCLSTQPAPAWYHMLIEDPGDINIYMYSTPLEDIDFICWGPFSDPYEPCVNGLTASTEVDCSYSPNPTENCYIPNGQTGEYYILMITNFSQNPCNITFSQTAGTGSTDCTILPPPVSNNGPLCVGETLELYAESVTNATYYWSGPGSYISTQQNPVIPNVTLANGGQYSCTITVNGNSSDPATTTVLIYNNPTLNLISGDTTVCANNPAYLIVNIPGFGTYSVEYTDDTASFTAEGLVPPIDTIFVYPSGSTTYTIQEVCNVNCCTPISNASVVINTYPFASAVISGSATICETEPAQLTFNLTGTPPWNITYTANGIDPLVTVANSSPHFIDVYPGQNTLYQISGLEDTYCNGETSGDADIVVAPAADVNAGNDETIPYGTTTTLNGLASGGSGDYSFQWEPAERVVNPASLTTQTVNMDETTIFTLTVTDLEGNCTSEDNVTITIEGGPLGCLPVADPEVICKGETTSINSFTSGGSGTYSYTWTSNPPGFTSDISNPQVAPQVTTAYNLAVNDGFNVVNGSVTVTVNELPLPDAGTDQSIPNGAYTTLTGSASGGSGSYTYQWQPAELLLNPGEQNPTTEKLYATTLFTLEVTDLTTGCVSESTDQVAVNVSGDVLASNPVAEPSEFCKGIETQLFALAGGGSGTYSYSWSGPDGFTSVDENPTLAPSGSGLFEVEVSDGFNTTNGSVFVTVHPAPEVFLGPPDSIVCVYDTVTLDAGSDGAEYLWSNGSVNRIVKVGSTGIGYDVKTMQVEVTSENGCKTNASINIHFDFSRCFGIEDHPHFGSISIYPNPSDGSFRVDISGYEGNLKMIITDLMGREIFTEIYHNLKGDFEKDIRLNSPGKGIYIISFKDKQNMYSEKLVIR